MRKNKNTKFIFPKYDIKAQMWMRALNDKGCETHIHNYYRISFFIWLFKSFIKGESCVIVFRYLNSSSKLNCFGKLIFEFIILRGLKTFNYHSFFVLHNVDRESDDAWPMITTIRRRLLFSSAKQVFVTDQKLIPFTLDLYPMLKPKLNYLCFGEYSSTLRYPRSDSALEDIAQWVGKMRAQGCLVGVAVASKADKNTHDAVVSQLLTDDGVALVCIGGIGVVPETRRLFYLTQNIDVPTSFLSEFDFLVKGSSDLSVLMTAYAAASVRLPIVTPDTGFFAHFVSEYNLGVVYTSSGDEFYEALRGSFDFDRFLLNHTWEIAADRLISAI